MHIFTAVHHKKCAVQSSEHVVGRLGSARVCLIIIAFSLHNHSDIMDILLNRILTVADRCDTIKTNL
jgi:hypothetical protein